MEAASAADATPLFNTIASLRPPKIPVTLNRRAVMQRDVINGGSLAVLKTIQSAEFSVATAGPMKAERQKNKRDLTRAHRSLESLCDKLWVRQTEMYSQLCHYHKLKREAARRVYQMKQEQLRNERQVVTERSYKARIASIDNLDSLFPDATEPAPSQNAGPNPGPGVWFVATEGAPEEPAPESEPVRVRSLSSSGQHEAVGDDSQSCPVLPALQAAHLETILKPDDALAVRERQANGNGVASPKQLVRSATDANDALPPINENAEAASMVRPFTSSTYQSVKLPFERTLSNWMHDNWRRDSVERKILQEPFTVYRMNEKGDFVPRGTMPLAFNTQAPSNKVQYRRRKLLEREKLNYRVCLKRGEDFRPEVSSVSVKDLRSTSSEENEMAPRREINYEFIAWVPL